MVLDQKGWSAHSWSSWEEALGLSQDTLERLYLFGLGMLQFPQGEFGEVSGKRKACASLLKFLPLQHLYKQQKIDVCMDLIEEHI